MDCDGCVKAVTRAATGAGAAPISLDLKSGEMRLPKEADVAAITRAIQRAGFGIEGAEGGGSHSHHHHH